MVALQWQNNGFLVFLEHQKSSEAEFTCWHKGLNNFNVLKTPLRWPTTKATTLYITLAEYYELTMFQFVEKNIEHKISKAT